MSELFDRFLQKNGLTAYYPNPNDGQPFAKLVALLDSNRNRALAKIHDLCPHAVDYRLEVGWIWDGHFRAKAGIEEGTDCIGVSLGVVHILRNLFLAMLSHPHILTNIGNSTIETRKEPYNPKTPIADLSDFTSDAVPTDRTRLRYSSELFSCAFNFLFHHEFGHLFDGHVDWISRKSRSSAGIDEVNTPLLSEVKEIDWQTLEVDGDSFAAIEVFAEKLRIMPVRGRAYARQRNRFGTRKNAIFGVFFAIYCVFRIFSQDESLDETRVLKAQHPPALYRQRFMLSTILDYVMEHSIVRPPELMRIFVFALTQAEEAFAILTGSSPLASKQMTEPFNRSTGLLGQLAENWRRLRPELDKLKRGGNLPQ